MSVYVLPNLPVTNNVTAAVAATYAAAVPIPYGFTEVDLTGAVGASVMLPPAVMGASCIINNMNGGTGTNTLAMFGVANPYNGNAVDSLVAHGVVAVTAGTTGLTLATGHCTQLICTTQGQWKQVGDFA